MIGYYYQNHSDLDYLALSLLILVIVIINNKEKVLMKNRNITNKIIIVILLIPLLVLSFGYGFAWAIENNFSSNDTAFDFVLIIDESGSMKQNDPENKRIDAAKLFVELNEILTKGNRVSVVGFGEQTNIYIEPTEIGKSKAEVMEAISSIKSNQALTDMKLALEDVKSMLDGRVKRNKTIIIFLTDGDLGVDDIPIPDEIRKGDDKPKEKPEPPSREDINADKDSPGTAGQGEDLEDPASGDDQLSESEDKQIDSEPDSAESRIEEYLEEYKDELLNLCYEYQEDKIQIFPIAFTGEANIEILEKIASITEARLWRSETASDIRGIYLDIFKYITSVFIFTSQQQEGEKLTGSIPVQDYIGKLIAISVSNEDVENPDIKMTPPNDAKSQDIQEIRDDSYVINAIEVPAQGNWDYEINGDLVVALDLVRMKLLDPVKAVYFMDSKVPISVGLSGIEGVSGEVDPSDFELSFKVKNPDMPATGWIELADDGGEDDPLEEDGIFNYQLDQISGPGDYLVELLIEHKPTGSSSLKETVFTVTDYQPVKKDIFLKIENNIIAGSSTKIYANFEDFTEGDFSYTISGPDGVGSSGKLLDNGEIINGDQETSDGIYSAIIGELQEIGDYMIKVMGEYESSEGYELTQVQEFTIGKYVLIEEMEDILEINGKDPVLEFNIRMESIYDQDLIIDLDPQMNSGGMIKSIEVGSHILEAGAKKDVGLRVLLKDDLETGEFTVSIPLVIGGVYNNETVVSFLYNKSSFMLDLKTLIGLILIFASLIPLIFLLYTIINMRKLGINLKSPRIIIEFIVFILLFIAGLIVFLAGGF